MTGLRFGILALPNFQYFPLAALPFDLGYGVHVLQGPLKEHLKAGSLKHWAEWLGSLDWESIEKRKAYLQVVADSNESKSNADIQGLLHDAYVSLMICAPLRAQIDYAIRMIGSGSSLNGRINADHIQEVVRYKRWQESHYMYSPGYHTRRLAYFKSADLLNDWKEVFHKLRRFRKKKRGTLTIALAIESLKNGLEADYLDFRLPLFVRASEAIMAARRNETKSAFVSRASKLLNQEPKLLFVSKRAKLETLLSDIFDVRSGSVHGMPFGWKIKERIKSKRRKEQYAYLSEECARRSIRLALSNDDLVRASADRKILEEWCSKHW